jgi:hypothetical protein
MTPADRARLQFAAMICGRSPFHAATIRRSVQRSQPMKNQPRDDRGLLAAIRFMTAEQLAHACNDKTDPHCAELAQLVRDAQKYDVIARVIALAYAQTESWREQHVGEALAYLCKAIADGDQVDWSDPDEEQGDALIAILRAHLPPADPVWRYIIGGEKSR